jgi:hypothetical protein
MHPTTIPWDIIGYQHDTENLRKVLTQSANFFTEALADTLLGFLQVPYLFESLISFFISCISFRISLWNSFTKL